MPLLTNQSTLTDEIYRQLRRRIVSQGPSRNADLQETASNLEPGTPLRTETLAREYGVSHTPIRECLRLLERDGLVQHLPRRGVVVRDVSRDEFDEMFTARRALEAVTVRGATEHATTQQIDEMRQLLEQSTLHVRAEDREGHIRIDQDFHRYIANCCNNSVVNEIVQSLINRFQLFFIRSQSTNTEGMKRGYKEHWDIFDAIASRDAQRAEEAMVFHIDNSRQHAIVDGFI